MSEKPFTPENPGEGKEEMKPYLKKVELQEDFACKCGKEFKAGEIINEVLTQSDLDTQIKHDPNVEVIPDKMCDDCLEDSMVEENIKRDKGV